MPLTQPIPAPEIDLAGRVYSHPKVWQTRRRIITLINRYLSDTQLSERLADLSQQFDHPTPRPWERFDWKEIHPNQIMGVNPELFAKVLASAAEIEDPIREYAQESYGYLHSFHPGMAQFIGGTVTPDGTLKSVGVWEKEERQHGPTFRKLYKILTGEPLQITPNSVSGYQPGSDPWQDAHDHILSRISTEWGALSIYLWLAAHSTGALQLAIAQPMQDEINHLAKFWGFSRWAFSDRFVRQFSGTTRNLVKMARHHQQERTHSDLFAGKGSQVRFGLEVGLSFVRVMLRLRNWNRTLSRCQLEHVFGSRRHLMEQFQVQRAA